MSTMLFLLLAVHLDKIQMKPNGSHAEYSQATEKSEEDDRFLARKIPDVGLNVL